MRVFAATSRGCFVTWYDIAFHGVVEEIVENFHWFDF